MKRPLVLASALLAIAIVIVLWPRRRDLDREPMPRLPQTASQPAPSPLKPVPGQPKTPRSENEQSVRRELTREFGQKLAASRSKPSGAEFLSKVNEVDTGLLIEQYKRQTNLLERIGLTWTLALTGDEKVIDLFKNTLFREFNGRVLTDWGGSQPDEQYVMEITAFCFGFLAKRHDAAYEMLKQGTDPAFWMANIKWKTSDTGESLGLLTTQSIQALGVTDRPDVPELLLQLRKLPLINTADTGIAPRTFESDLLQAAYYHAGITDLGWDGFKNWYFRPVSDVFDEDGRFGRWAASSEGQQWLTWVKEREVSRNR